MLSGCSVLQNQNSSIWNRTTSWSPPTSHSLARDLLRDETVPTFEEQRVFGHLLDRSDSTWGYDRGCPPPAICQTASPVRGDARDRPLRRRSRSRYVASRSADQAPRGRTSLETSGDGWATRRRRRRNRRPRRGWRLRLNRHRIVSYLYRFAREAGSSTATIADVPLRFLHLPTISPPYSYSPDPPPSTISMSPTIALGWTAQTYWAISAEAVNVSVLSAPSSFIISVPVTLSPSLSSMTKP